jgi:DNA ligase 1
MITQPMLASKCKDKSKIKYPVLATPKLDGIRCLVKDGKTLSRKFKPIPNHFIRERIENLFPNGVDGELMIPGKPFGEATGIIMSSKNAKDVPFQYHVFDYVINEATAQPYNERMNNLAQLPDFLEPKYWDAVASIVKVLPIQINNDAELNAFEDECLARGYEGIMIRIPDGPYKCGRSTEKEGFLLKIKRFEDSEAEIIGFDEKMHNDNELIEDELGYAKRSHIKEGMIPAGTLGNLVVKDLKSKVTFSLGTGFDDKLRDTIWCNQDQYLGKIIKYKCQPYGALNLPRFPVFLGFRDKNDMDGENE